MIIDSLKMAPFNTTLMGVIRGVFDHYKMDASTPMLYGATGHAFLINIHSELCPSSPYCWNPEYYYKLLENLGIKTVDHGFYSPESSEAERNAVEEIVKRNIDAGIPCSLLNMENQMVFGYDESGFHTAQPWAPNVDFPPSHLSFGAWEEIGSEIHINFFSFHKSPAKDKATAIRESLQYAIDLHHEPEKHTSKPYGAGPCAYENWIIAIKNGHGSSHGNWWNATVWAECRGNASKYFEQMAAEYTTIGSQASDLKEEYAAISEALVQAADKEMDTQEKIKLIEQAKTTEESAVSRIADLLEKF